MKALIRFAFLLLLAPATQAQVVIDETRLPEPWIEIVADITGDGAPEILRAMPFSDEYDVISIETGQAYGVGDPILLPIWANRTGDPGIELTSPTSFLIRTGCFACGRTHSFIEHKIAFRDGRYVVAGYTEVYIDRLFATAITCDVNYLTRRSEIKVDDTLVKKGSARERYPLAQWVNGSPPACDAAEEYKSDSFLETWLAE
ncbi:MAG: hypothetical protein AAGF13_05255 [Pseudomonadota bacterium]